MIEVVPFSGEPDEFLKAVDLPFGWTPHADDLAVMRPLFEPERALVARDAGRIVGTAGIYTWELGVPGGSDLAMAGVTMVGVHPTHRRRGILRRMMRLQLDAIHERGEPLAGLWASEGAIYQRFGYGWGTLRAGFEVDRTRTAFREPHEPAGSFRLLDTAEAARLLPPFFEAIRHQRPGSQRRSSAWWAADMFHDPERRRDGGSALQIALYEVDGEAAGYVAYRLHPDWDERGPKSTLQLLEAMARDPEATRSVWGYLFGVDLVSTIRGRQQPVDHPLLLSLDEPRRLGWTVGDGLWLRIVDLPAALSGRVWRGSHELVLEVADAFCAWNSGRWRLETDDGRASVTRTDAEPDLALDAGDLAAVYLGGWQLGALVSAGRARELRPGAAARFDAAAATDAQPWCPQVF